MTYSVTGNLRDFEHIWDQERIPVVLQLGGPILVRLPYSPGNRNWLRNERRSEPAWRGKCWKLPAAWFNDFVNRAIQRYSRLYIIQSYRASEVCSAACQNAPALAWVPITATAMTGVGSKSARSFLSNWLGKKWLAAC